MAISLRPSQLKRYYDILRLLAKYGRSDAIRSVGRESLPEEPEADEVGESDEGKAFAADLERLGPTFIKLGQLLSTRAELFPPTYLDALAQLQDNVEPFDSQEARTRI